MELSLKYIASRFLTFLVMPRINIKKEFVRFKRSLKLMHILSFSDLFNFLKDFIKIDRLKIVIFYL